MAIEIIIENKTEGINTFSQATVKENGSPYNYSRNFPKYWTATQIQEAVELDIFGEIQLDVAPTVTDNRV